MTNTLLLTTALTLSAVGSMLIPLEEVKAEDCLLDRDNDGVVDLTTDTDGAANSNDQNDALACGIRANATGSQATSIGTDSNGTGDFSVAVGYSADASQNSATSLGYQANAGGNSSTALGRSANASGSGSIRSGSASSWSS